MAGAEYLRRGKADMWACCYCMFALMQAIKKKLEITSNKVVLVTNGGVSVALRLCPSKTTG